MADAVNVWVTWLLDPYLTDQVETARANIRMNGIDTKVLYTYIYIYIYIYILPPVSLNLWYLGQNSQIHSDLVMGDAKGGHVPGLIYSFFLCPKSFLP